MREERTTVFYGAVTVGERGQVVIPAAARRAFGIRAGEKLLIIGHPRDRALVMVRMEDLLRFIDELREFLGLASSPEAEGEEQ